MLSAYGFFIVVIFLGMLLMGFSGLAGLRAWQMRRYQHWDMVERTGLWYAMEFSLFTMLFGLLPFLLAIMLRYESTVWRIGSLLIALFLLIVMGRVYYRVQLYRMRFPLALISLLVLSAILLTIELVNVFWWSSLAGYAGGLTWILFLSAVQYMIFVTYDRNPTPEPNRIPTVYSTHTDDTGHTAYIDVGGVQRHNGADHTNRTPNHQPYAHRDPVAYARRQRYAHRFPNTRTTYHGGRSFPDAPAGSQPDTFRR